MEHTGKLTDRPDEYIIKYTNAFITCAHVYTFFLLLITYT